MVNGAWKPLRRPAEVIDGTVYVSLYFVAESLGRTVKWDAGSWTVEIEVAGKTLLRVALRPCRGVGKGFRPDLLAWFPSNRVDVGIASLVPWDRWRRRGPQRRCSYMWGPQPMPASYG